MRIACHDVRECPLCLAFGRTLWHNTPVVLKTATNSLFPHQATKKHVSNKYARSVSAVVLGTLAQKSEAPQADTVLRMKGHVKDRFLRVAPGKCDRKQQKRYGNWQQPVSRQAKPNKKNPGHLALKLQVGLAEALCTVSFKTRV